MKKALFNLHIAIFLAGFTAILGRLILLNEAVLVIYRLAIGFVLWGLFLWWKKQLVFPGKKRVAELFGVGSLIAIHWVLFYGSIKYGNVSIALVCLSSMAFFTSFLEPLIMRRKPDLLEVLFGLMTIAGIYIIFDFHPHFKLGIIFGILSAFVSSLFPIFNKQLIEKVDHRNLLFYELLGGFLCLALILPVYLRFFPAASYLPTVAEVCWLLVLVVLCTLLAFDLQLRSLSKVSAFTIALSYNLEPVYGIILAFVFFGENHDMQPQFYLGAAIIAATIVLHSFSLWYRHKKVNPMATTLIE